MTIKSYDALPPEAIKIRTAVFMDEQGFNDEFDRIDEFSTHLVVFDNDEPAAVCRFYFDEKMQEYLIGRLAVVKEYRGKGLGRELVKEAERLIKMKGGKTVSLHSQCQAVPFYERLGYIAFGESDFDESCPHRWMRKNIFG